MAFKVKLKASAKKDLFKAIEYYEEINQSLSERFYAEFLELRALFQTNPFFIIKYRSIRTYKLKSFPYVVHFVVNEENQLVTIIAIIFGKQQRTNFEYRFKDI